jgi:uncharacterized protein (DUF305 family)
MTTKIEFLLGLLPVAALAACGGSNDQAADDAVDMNDVTINADVDVSNETAMNQANLFAPAMMKMSEQMMAAVGADAGDSWVRKMIAHHQGAIDMSQIVLQHDPAPSVAKMARDTIAKQSQEITELQKFIRNGPPDQQSSELYKPAMMDMQKAMKGAKGTNISETYLRKMLAHHDGAIGMSAVALQAGIPGAIRDNVEQTKASQSKEARMITDMLAGKA